MSTPSTSVPTRTRFVLSFWLFALCALSYLDRTNVAIAGPQLAHDFTLGNQRLGWIFSAFLVGYAIFQIPAGLLAVRFGPRRVLAGGVLVWGLSNALTAVLPAGLSYTIVLLIGLRCTLGLAEAVIFPATTQFVARWIPQSERGKVNGLIFAGVGAGSGLTPPLLSWIIRTYDWRAAFWFDACLGILAAIATWRILRDRPEEHPYVNAAERLEIRESLTSFASDTRHAEHVKENTVSMKLLFSRIDLPALMLSYFAFGYTCWIFFSWFFLYMNQAHGLNLKTSAYFTMMPFLSMMFFCFAGGLLSDRLTKSIGLRAGRCYLASSALVLTAIFLLVGSRVHSASYAAILLALGAGCLYLSQSAFWSVSTDLAGQNSGVFSSLVNMACQVGAVLTASLTPWLASHFDWRMPFTAAAVLSLLGAVTWLLVHPERPLEF